MNEVEGGNSLKKKTLRELVKTNKVKRDGQGAKGKPFLYSSILVQSIYPVPVYQNPKMTTNPHVSRAYSGTDDFTNLQKDGKNFVPESLPQEQEKIAAKDTHKDDAKTQNLTTANPSQNPVQETDIIDLTNMADLEILEIQ
ncbi:MAG: hypothetical protein DWB56_02710 [Candidatus Jettenia sp.]|uniref:Uncharacterized protein n=1 Tax=Candidatus Jettenia caeni TaxID=247490 RepID=I3IGQ9_9BACT|nr:hypothetical protein [Candidatus Jettenia sp. AMX1]MBC6927868.1 hypothetical protein [Candidatus Jettenia sp.]WKZ16239.1 MAG: hypothetical protein QY317_02820 [Candidatus Jettenia caeni]KAA0251276.1 MAG: hypothetical protein EDM77_01990 [Candidatus Jettenia sp. AMX1]MCE7880300.1 hypothetical protein [Candidatus Jettenia sp. AMX1]MCQ3926167.1 hypothetical protein [Candidatus Jettenia sp.]